MVGQSNMQGHAGFGTLPYMLEDPATVALHNRMVDKDGKPKVNEAVYVSLLTDYGTKQGPLTAGFGASREKIGPELAFGFTMHEMPQEPILIIKTDYEKKCLAEVHTAEDAIAYKGVSNQTYHYLGSAKILSRLGEALAEALINKKRNP